ncbi:MAG: chloramphenicol acetyltransferase [Saprospiraceae bacterium]
MRTPFDLENWERKAHYELFKTYEEPFHGVTVTLDCTRAYQQAKAARASFFLWYLHRAMRVMNELEIFRLRIEEDSLYLYDCIHAGVTVDRPNGTFGFSYIPFDWDFEKFASAASEEMDRVRQESTLVPEQKQDNVAYFSSLPWIAFTGLSHARKFSNRESIPKITNGKMTERNGRRSMPFSIHVHHALIDGRQLGEYLDRLQELLDE